jgi:hypothetical protein
MQNGINRINVLVKQRIKLESPVHPNILLISSILSILIQTI